MIDRIRGDHDARWARWHPARQTNDRESTPRSSDARPAIADDPRATGRWRRATWGWDAWADARGKYIAVIAAQLPIVTEYDFVAGFALPIASSALLLKLLPSEPTLDLSSPVRLIGVVGIGR